MIRERRSYAGLHEHVLETVRLEVSDRAAVVLDLGCGSGALLNDMQTAGFRRLAGVDIVPPSGLQGVELHAADLDAGALPFATARFDFITAVEVLEHVENPGAFFRELRRVLAPRGRVLLTTPNLHSIEARLRLLLTGHLKQFDAIGDPTHILPVFRVPLQRLLARHDLQILRCWSFPQNGSSPSSRPVLRAMAMGLRLLGLRGDPPGDSLCLLLGPSATDPPAGSALRKAEIVTGHYAGITPASDGVTDSDV